MADHRKENEKLIGRVALLNAENERLKKIIVRYEKKIAEDNVSTDYSRVSEAEVDRLRDLCKDRLAEVEFWKRQAAEVSATATRGADLDVIGPAVRNEVQEVVTRFKSEIEALKEDKNEAIREIERLNKLLERSPTDRLSHHGSVASENANNCKEHSRAIQSLKIEVEELRNTLRTERHERKDMISKEELFEKLKEQEVKLLASISINPHQPPISPSTVVQLQQELTLLSRENDRLQKLLKEMQARERERKEKLDQDAEVNIQKAAKKRLEGLEGKINLLIEENESILRENEQLKYRSNADSIEYLTARCKEACLNGD
jgi:hypothetical protein